jgi:sialate O-acetylesterase
MAVPVWGWASPGAAITVDLNGKTYHAVTGSDGKWMLKLAKQKAGGPYELRVSGDGNQVVLHRVLIGDVWICSGQSNMAYSFNEQRARKYYAGEMDSAKNDQIRQILVPRTASSVPAADFARAGSAPAADFARAGSAPAADLKTSGWLPVEPANMAAFSVAAYFFAKNLFERYHVPVGLINTSYGGTTTEAWTSTEGLKEFPWLSPGLLQKDSLRPQDVPASLFNAMVAPLIPYGIRGVIWYQGENNAWKASEYRSTFPNMIKDWRAKWGQGNFPFVFQQLVNWRKVEDQPDESDWAELREAQTMTLSTVPKTGMAVGIELGESEDIHPVKKQEIGYRLFRAAEATAYGVHDRGLEGPFYRSMEVRDGKVIVRFDTKGSRLVVKGRDTLSAHSLSAHSLAAHSLAVDTLSYFAIAGADRKFVWARAVIRGDNKVEVWSDQVAAPVAVRYAWANNPEGCNLYNAEGLPASPFRTDPWPGKTVDKGKGLLKRQFRAANGDTLRYRILYPSDHDAKKRYPLVLFLHGVGERGRDNERQLQVGGVGNLFTTSSTRFPCIAVFPQCPPDQYWATVDIDSKTTPYTFHFNYQKPMTPAMEAVMELTGDIIKEGAVDTNRVYIMGTSMGAIGTYEAVYRFPQLFAGAVAVCGAGDSSAYTACTAKVPFLIYHGDADPVVGVKESQGMYQRLTSLGGDAQIITYPGVGHNSWRNAFASPDLLPKLFSKTRATVQPAPALQPALAVQHPHAPVIFETDMGNDVDDALALDMLYKYMDEGRINLLAINSNKNNGYSAAFIQLMNNWYGYPGIPVGKIVNGANSQDNIHEYVRAVCEYRMPDGRKAFNAPDTASRAFKDPVALYREVLAGQPDHSVTIISVGFSTNLARLLDSRPDHFSPLDGKALVGKKVKLLSAMAGDFAGKNAVEYNVVKDIGAAIDLFTKWPGEIVVSPYELGRAITYPARSIENDFAWAVNHPVVLAYKNYMTMPYDRPAWDLTAALYAIEGAGQYFGLSPKGTVSIDQEGHSFFTPSATGRHRYLSVNDHQVGLIRDRFVSLITGTPKRR